MALVPADLEKYEVKEIIGRGSFGIIRKVRRKQDGLILCRKEINYLKMSTKERDQLHAEFSILSSLKHSNIVGYYHREHLKDTQELYLYMEYCGGGDLGTVIKDLKKNNEYAKEEFVWRIFSQIVTALYRCHYGVDPPEPGSELSRQKDGRPVSRGKMILHRDLKPENIFLGEDQCVKLGDFGLSKLMQSHDFASTYVGTPFYMSPEICAAEKYTLHSDIWSLGCIMYELCTKTPPFNATSHIQLVQCIRKGEFKPIPSIYSKDLANVIASCLKTNPMHRPDTVSLLSIPYVWVSRRQQEMVVISKALKTREELAEHKLRQAEERLSALEADKASTRLELDAQVRREWEVRARLEIDRQVQLELDRLRKKFDSEVEQKVSAALAQHHRTTESKPLKELRNLNIPVYDKENHDPSSSINTEGDDDFPSQTDLSDFSDGLMLSPNTSNTRHIPPKKSRTPLARAKTTFDSPADVQMGEPSPMSISSLSLSPRRNAAAQATANATVTAANARNIFARAERQKARWEPKLAYSSGDDEEDLDFADDSDDDIPDLPSPTKAKPQIADTDPFKHPNPSWKAKPALTRQNTTATMQKLITKPSLFPTSNAGAKIRAGIAGAGLPSTVRGIPRAITDGEIKSNRVRSPSPGRGLSKIPSRSDLREHANAFDDSSTSPLRRAATSSTKLRSKLAGSKELAGNGGVGGRTLVELAQARAGGRQVVSKPFSEINDREKDWFDVPVWDLEKHGDDMPSPFLKRDVRAIRNIR
ncbi:hypothetical protein B0A52_05007 [Exophiala mesophila]|uniref:non-specific serine/threonine protein kinase n=1 Tax=Exophiala mesophila TaxID=212818 RepID=A0A438N6N5_EXOME|nr:hypothetical protein B0A52_05007 [Exophiala mesophila]